MMKLQEYYEKIKNKIERIFFLLKIDNSCNLALLALDGEKKDLKIYSNSYGYSDFENFFSMTETYQNLNKRLERVDTYNFVLENTMRRISPEKNHFFISPEILIDKKLYFLTIDISSKDYSRCINNRLRVNYVEGLLEKIFRDFKSTLKSFLSGGEGHDLEAEELINFSTKEFFKGLRVEASADNHNTFEIFNKISNLKYENTQAKGEIIIGNLDSLVIKNLIKFQKDIGIDEYRKIRKLLEGTKGGYSLFTDLERVYGFIGKNLAKTLKNSFKLKIISGYHWELFYEDERVLKIVEGIPHFENIISEKKVFISKIEGSFPELLNWEKQRLWSLIEATIEKNRGALLVITDGCMEETERLAIHATTFNPFEITGELISNFSKIDGAVLMSPRRMCCAIGVILDGLITEKGDSSRGARYNSAIKYYETMKSKYRMVVVVISEDGSIDILG